MKPNLFFFDLDGTLIDSEPAIRTCFKKTLEKVAPALTSRADSVLIGPPLNQTAAELLCTNDIELVNHFCNLFKSEYDEKCHLLTPLYPQCAEVLLNLKSEGHTLVIATNKRFSPTLSILKYQKLDHLFSNIDCSDQYPGQSKSLFVRQRLSNLNLDSYQHLFMVGDTDSDLKVALDNNLRFIWASYGYQPLMHIPNRDDVLTITSLIELKKMC